MACYTTVLRQTDHACLLLLLLLLLLLVLQQQPRSSSLAQHKPSHSTRYVAL
jgi:hypothetical protein